MASCPAESVYAMNNNFLQHLNAELAALRSAGLYKAERVLTTPQGARVRTLRTPR